MDRGTIDFASQRRNLDLPSKPESGLAEWTSKIKELQRQVDADEEEETKRLEQEIAASRLARMRRSTGRGTSTDLSNTDIAAALKETTPTVADGSRSPDERRRNQDDALQKLSNDGANRGLADYNSYVASKSMKASSAAPVSLAAFIGGKASGPRLNKHAPQQDTHDPTQFEQRTFTGPHPIFGRGGVAMPGMVARSRGSIPRSREETPTPRMSDDHGQNAAPPTDTFKVKSVVEKSAPQRPVATTQFGVIRNEPPRQRTFSTPTGPVLSSAIRPSHSPSFNSSKSEQNSPRLLSHSPSPILKGTSRPTTPKEPSSAANNVFPLRSNNVSPHPRSPVVRSPSPPKTPSLGSPGLAKPIQPSPRKSLQGPQIPISSNTSPVFLRPPPAKEPTPSISRLQGRGFVQSMVRANSQIDTSAGAGSPSAADKSKEATKKASVLDRWHHGNEAAPVIAPKPVPLRKVRTMDSTMDSSSTSSAPVQVFPTYTPPPPKPEKPEFANVTLKSRASLPLIQQERQSPSQKSDGGTESPTTSQKRALGSSTTMVSYIKPIKTGEGSSVVAPPSRPLSSASRGRPTTPAVDELGVRVRSRTRSIGGDSGHRSGTPGAGAGGKPLTHPTKSRPHKPRKAKTVLSGNQSARTEHRAQADSADTDDQVVSAATITQEKPASSPQDIGSKLAARTALDDEKVSSVSESPPTPGTSRRVHFPLPLELPSPQPVQHAEKSPATPIKHSRIPSTGNRATVMDVAQVFNEHQQFTQSEPPHSPLSSTQVQSPLSSTSPDEEDSSASRRDVKSLVASWGAQNGNDFAPLTDKRKSSYEKYSAFTLPPLAEEKTPVPSPVGTLARNIVSPSLDTPVKSSSHSSGQYEKPERPVKSAALDSCVHLNIVDAPLPIVDVDSLITENSCYTADSDLQTISVEVVSIVGAAAAPINRDMNVFYDSETLAIVHRFKVKSSGLVSTKVWSWIGAKSQINEKEERKLQELARRYNTTLMTVEQYGEPAELVHLLGGQVVTRQGSRAHWTTENTAMHIVRSVGNCTYIDEMELSIKNLCSGFSYCISLLETFYVWHGRGSTARERQAALTYAQTLAPDASNVIELFEASNDDDEMFWIILGEGDYGRADYWRWKSELKAWKPQIWLVDTTSGKSPISPVTSLKGFSPVHSHVYIVDCLWEYFVLVGSDARGQRSDIRLALSVATRMADKLAPMRPYVPTVHVLVLPSQLPIDLRLTFRDFDEAYLNQGNVPEHMNILAANDAFDHLTRTSWERHLLKDPAMLPLGLANVP